jgi:predicted peptidase
MSKGIILPLLASLVAFTACKTSKPVASARAGGQSALHLELRQSKVEGANYLLFLPAGYSASDRKEWPLILFLHGAGERGNDVSKVAVHGPPKVAPNMPDFPFIVLSPQCPDGQIWSKSTLLALLSETQKKYRVDASRIYLTGLSMGGYGTWDLGLSYPEKFAAIAPICGGGEWITILLSSPQKSEALRSLGVWAFHGADDTVVPPSESERMVEKLRKSGVKEAKLTIYPGTGHDSWTATYSNPDFYSWLLQHKRL